MGGEHKSGGSGDRLMFSSCVSEVNRKNQLIVKFLKWQPLKYNLIGSSPLGGDTVFLMGASMKSSKVELHVIKCGSNNFWQLNGAEH